MKLYIRKWSDVEFIDLTFKFRDDTIYTQTCYVETNGVDLRIDNLYGLEDWLTEL